MAPDFAHPRPDDDQHSDEGSGYFNQNPAEEFLFDDFREVMEVIDHVRRPAFDKFEALLSDKVVIAVAELLHDFDEGLYQGRTSGHPSLAAIDECFTATEPEDAREVLLAVRAVIDRALEERFADHGESETDTAAAGLLYDQLLRSGGESLLKTTFDSIFKAYQERLQNVFTEPFCEGMQLQRQRLALLGLDADFDGVGRDTHARELYQEKVQQAGRISQEILAEEYRQMDEAYPSFVELAVSELFNLASDLMQTSTEDDTPGGDYATSLESEWRERYADAFRERLDTSLMTAREQLQSALAELYEALPASAKGLG